MGRSFSHSTPLPSPRWTEPRWCLGGVLPSLPFPTARPSGRISQPRSLSVHITPLRAPVEYSCGSTTPAKPSPWLHACQIRLSNQTPSRLISFFQKRRRSHHTCLVASHSLKIPPEDVWVEGDLSLTWCFPHTTKSKPLHLHSRSPSLSIYFPSSYATLVVLLQVSLQLPRSHVPRIFLISENMQSYEDHSSHRHPSPRPEALVRNTDTRFSIPQNATCS